MRRSFFIALGIGLCLLGCRELDPAQAKFFREREALYTINNAGLSAAAGFGRSFTAPTKVIFRNDSDSLILRIEFAEPIDGSLLRKEADDRFNHEAGVRSSTLLAPGDAAYLHFVPSPRFDGLKEFSFQVVVHSNRANLAAGRLAFGEAQRQGYFRVRFPAREQGEGVAQLAELNFGQGAFSLTLPRSRFVALRNPGRRALVVDVWDVAADEIEFQGVGSSTMALRDEEQGGRRRVLSFPLPAGGDVALRARRARTLDIAYVEEGGRGRSGLGRVTFEAPAVLEVHEDGLRLADGLGTVGAEVVVTRGERVSFVNLSRGIPAAGAVSVHFLSRDFLPWMALGEHDVLGARREGFVYNVQDAALRHWESLPLPRVGPGPLTVGGLRHHLAVDAPGTRKFGFRVLAEGERCDPGRAFTARSPFAGVIHYVDPRTVLLDGGRIAPAAAQARTVEEDDTVEFLYRHDPDDETARAEILGWAALLPGDGPVVLERVSVAFDRDVADDDAADVRGFAHDPAARAWSAVLYVSGRPAAEDEVPALRLRYRGHYGYRVLYQLRRGSQTETVVACRGRIQVVSPLEKEIADLKTDLARRSDATGKLALRLGAEGSLTYTNKTEIDAIVRQGLPRYDQDRGLSYISESATMSLAMTYDRSLRVDLNPQLVSGDFGGGAKRETLLDLDVYSVELLRPLDSDRWHLKAGRFSVQDGSQGLATAESGNALEVSTAVGQSVLRADYLVLEESGDSDKKGTSGKPRPSDRDVEAIVLSLHDPPLPPNPLINRWGMWTTGANDSIQGDRYATLGGLLGGGDLFLTGQVIKLWSLEGNYSRREADGDRVVIDSTKTPIAITDNPDAEGLSGLITLRLRDVAPLGYKLVTALQGGYGTGDDAGTARRDEGFIGRTTSYAPDKLFLGALAGDLKDNGLNTGGGTVANKTFGNLKLTHAFKLREQSASWTLAGHSYHFTEPIAGRRHAGEELDVDFSLALQQHVTLSIGGGVFLPGDALERQLDDLIYIGTVNFTVNLQNLPNHFR